MAYPNYPTYPTYPAYPFQAPMQDQLAQLRAGQGISQPMPQIGVQAAQTAPQGLSPSSRPVANREEALSTPADFSGSIMVFPDMTHNRVYLKRWNMQTGAADFMEFEPSATISQEPKIKNAPVPYAMANDVKTLQETVERLQKEVDKLKNPDNAASSTITEKKGGKKNGTDNAE